MTLTEPAAPVKVLRNGADGSELRSFTEEAVEFDAEPTEDEFDAEPTEDASVDAEADAVPVEDASVAAGADATSVPEARDAAAAGLMVVVTLLAAAVLVPVRTI